MSCGGWVPWEPLVTMGLSLSLSPQPVIYYLVKWCSLPYEDSTWELKEDVDEGKVREFKRIQARHPELKRVVSDSLWLHPPVPALGLPTF